MDYQVLYELLPKQPIKWTVADLEIWLKYIGLSVLNPKFSIFVDIIQIAYDWQCIARFVEIFLLKVIFL